MAAKPPARPAFPSKTRDISLKVSPEEADRALLVLQSYVEERAALTTDKGKLDLIRAARLMKTFAEFKDKVADMVKSPAEKAYDSLRFSMIPELMDEDGVTSTTLEGIGRVGVQYDVQVKVLAKDGLQQWLIDNELEDMITSSVNAQTLAAFVRKRLREGKELPSDFIEVKPIVRASITKV